MSTAAAKAQFAHPAQQGMTPGRYNYSSFTSPVYDSSTDVLSANYGTNNPEAGMLYKNAPCKSCYELVAKRTSKNKTFAQKGDPHKIWVQSATDDINYLDDHGRWLTIKPWLTPESLGIYSAKEQPVPVTVNTVEGFSSLGGQSNGIRFNNRLELIYESPEHILTSLGTADWSHHTAGDDGVYVTDAWPGIDMELHTVRGAVKTNFIVKHAFPMYAAGKLLINDHLALSTGLSLYSEGGNRFTGVLEIRNVEAEKAYVISTATAFEKNDPLHTLKDLEYRINDDTLGIALPGDFLNRPAASYPVIIDPLVSVGTSVAVPGSTYSPGWTVGCATVDSVFVPADLTVSDIQFTFEYLASGGALMTNGALDFHTGTCRSPGLTGWYWYCLDYTPGTCGGDNVSIISDLGSCIPPVQCPSYILNVTMNMYQSYLSDPACSDLYITATEPLTMTIVGHTFDVDPITVVTNPICQGDSTQIYSAGVYGVTPYTYVWSPGGATTPSITVHPVVATTYSLTATDACDSTATTTATVNVNPVAPITGSANICIGQTSTLADAIAGGSWTSGNLSVVTVDPVSGVITGIAAGTTTITYINPFGCLVTTPVVITTVPAVITGPGYVCAGSTITLSDATPGGTWYAATSPVASVSLSGVVSGLTAGNLLITYSLGSSCWSTYSVSVFALPVITGLDSTNPTTCITNDGTITLTGLLSGQPYTVNYIQDGTPQSATVLADASGNIVITGLPAGGYVNFTVTDPAGCTSLPWPGPVLLSWPSAPAPPTVANNGPACEGSVVALTATSVPGASYSWTGPGGFASALQDPFIDPASTANSGVYVVTATYLGCQSAPSATTVVIHPTPAISSIVGTPPTSCHGSDGTILLTGLLSGAAYNISYLDNGALVTVAQTADATGNVLLTGLSAGLYDSIVVNSFNCLSVPLGPVFLADPGAPPLPHAWSNSPICTGAILDLFATDSGQNITFAWSGPAGFASSLQNPELIDVQPTAAGVYTVTVANANCSAFATTAVSLYPPITLTGITPSQIISYGSSIHLSVDGALYYLWSPNDGSLNNINISDPVASPLITTTYIVTGTSIYGCMDTASVTIDVSDTGATIIPSAFTPNNDGRNDVFRIASPGTLKLVDFSVFNRWGELVYHNGTNIREGWDGTWNGEAQDVGVYNYSIIVADNRGNNIYYKGTVTLLR